MDPDPVPELPPDIFEFWGTLPFPEEGLPAGSDQKLEISVYEGPLSGSMMICAPWPSPPITS